MKLAMSSLLVAFASSALVAAAPAAAADPVPAMVEAPSGERLELARKFVALGNPGDSVMEMFRTGFWQGISNSIEDEAVLTEAKAGLDKYLARLEPKLRESMPTVLEAYAQVYAREFSAEELRQMNAFAVTPAGRHYLNAYSKVESDDLVVDATYRMMETLAPVLQDIQKEMCAAKAAKRVAMGDKKARCPLAAAAETKAG